MTPDEIPSDLVDDAIDGWHNPPNENGKHTVLPDDLRRQLPANLLPAHEAQIRAKVARQVRELAAAQKDAGETAENLGQQWAGIRQSMELNHLADWIARGGR